MTYHVGNYDIYKNMEIGRGSSSVVYKGNGPEGIVAIKKINKLKLATKTLLMLEEEISIMQFIKENPHENIVRCYDIIDDIDTIYFVLEYCDSGDLKNILKKPMKEQYAQIYFSQIVNGLKYLNENNIVHRDIKPSNILLTNNMTNIKICDFGFARKKNVVPKVNTICGSPLYMAPEIFESKSYGFHTDIWSIGIILYEMLFGFHPFGKCKDINDLTSALESFYLEIPPKNYVTDISTDCISFLKALLEKNIVERIEWDKIFIHPWIIIQNLSHLEQTIEENNEQQIEEEVNKLSSDIIDDSIASQTIFDIDI